MLAVDNISPPRKGSAASLRVFLCLKAVSAAAGLKASCHHRASGPFLTLSPPLLLGVMIFVHPADSRAQPSAQAASPLIGQKLGRRREEPALEADRPGAGRGPAPIGRESGEVRSHWLKRSEEAGLRPDSWAVTSCSRMDRFIEALMVVQSGVQGLSGALEGGFRGFPPTRFHRRHDESNLQFCPLSHLNVIYVLNVLKCYLV